MRLTVCTADQPMAGTSADVEVVLHGALGSTAPMRLLADGREPFRRGGVDVFSLQVQNSMQCCAATHSLVSWCPPTGTCCNQRCGQVPHDVGRLQRLEVTRQGPSEGPRDGWLLQDVTVQPLHEDAPDGPPVFFHAMTWLGGGNASTTTLVPGACIHATASLLCVCMTVHRMLHLWHVTFSGVQVTYHIRIVSSAVHGSVPPAAPCVRLLGKAATTPMLVLGGQEGLGEGPLVQTCAVHAVDVGELHSIQLGCESRTVRCRSPISTAFRCAQEHALSWHCSQVVVTREDALWDAVSFPCDAWVTGPHAGPGPFFTLHPEGHVQAAVPRQYHVRALRVVCTRAPPCR